MRVRQSSSRSSSAARCVGVRPVESVGMRAKTLSVT